MNEKCHLNGDGNWCYTHDGYYPHERLDADIAAAEERGRRAGFSEGVAEAARLTESLCAEFEAEAQRQSESGNSHNATADRYHAFGCERAAMRIRSLAPRDSRKEG